MARRCIYASYDEQMAQGAQSAGYTLSPPRSATRRNGLKPFLCYTVTSLLHSLTPTRSPALPVANGRSLNSSGGERHSTHFLSAFHRAVCVRVEPGNRGRHMPPPIPFSSVGNWRGSCNRGMPWLMQDVIELLLASARVLEAQWSDHQELMKGKGSPRLAGQPSSRTAGQRGRGRAVGGVLRVVAKLVSSGEVVRTELEWL